MKIIHKVERKVVRKLILYNIIVQKVIHVIFLHTVCRCLRTSRKTRRGGKKLLRATRKKCNICIHLLPMLEDVWTSRKEIFSNSTYLYIYLSKANNLTRDNVTFLLPLFPSLQANSRWMEIWIGQASGKYKTLDKYLEHPKSRYWGGHLRGL